MSSASLAARKLCLLFPRISITSEVKIWGTKEVNPSHRKLVGYRKLISYSLVEGRLGLDMGGCEAANTPAADKG